jgi:hemerythrin
MSDILTDDLLTGIAAIDEQHRNLFVRAGSIVDAMRRTHATRDVRRLLDFLDSYCAEHFQTEEDAMERLHVPDMLKHRTAHKAYLRRVQALCEELDATGANADLAMRARMTLVDLFAEHIKEHDLPMSRHLRERADGDFGL